MKHTPYGWTEPRLYKGPGEKVNGAVIYGGDARMWARPDEKVRTIVGIKNPDERDIANLERIHACVTACEGISPELLETGVLQELVESCKFMAQDYYCRMNPAQMPTLAKRAFDTFTRIEAAKEGTK